MAQVKIQSDFNGNAIINGINYLSSGLQMEVNAVNPNNIDLKYMNRRIYFDIPYYDYTDIAGQPLGTDVTTTIQAMDALFDDSVFLTTIVGFGGVAGGSGTYSSQNYAAWLVGKTYLGGNSTVDGKLDVTGGSGANAARSSIKNLDLTGSNVFWSESQTSQGGSLKIADAVLNYTDTGRYTEIIGGHNLSGNVTIKLPPIARPNAEGTYVISNDGLTGDASWTDISSLGSSPWTESGNNIYYNTGNVGIGTTTPAAKLDISDSNSNIAVFRTTNANADLYLRASGTGSDGKVGIRASDNNLRFISNGATQASFNGSNLGIGTTTPSEKLHVVGNVDSQAIYVDRTNENAGINSPFAKFGLHHLYGSANNLVLQKSGRTTYTSFNTQSSGIGIHDSANPNQYFQLSNTGMTGYSGFSFKYVQHNSSTNNLGEVLVLDNSVASNGQRGTAKITGDVTLHDYSSGTGVERVRIGNDGSAWFDGGNVGIGTTTPSAPLTVIGKSYLQGDVAVGPQATAGPISGYTLSVRDVTPSIYLKDQTGVVGDGRLHVDGNIFSIGVDPNNATTNAALRFETRGSERMRIDHDGNVGIGTTSPFSTLYVDDGVTSSNTIFVNSYNRIGWTGGARQWLEGWSGRIAFKGGNEGEFARFSGSGSVNRLNVSRAIHLSASGGDNGDVRFTRLDVGKVAIGNSADDASGTLAVGNVGIGTTTPSEKLHVVGNVVVDSGNFNMFIGNSSTGNSITGENNIALGRGAMTNATATSQYGVAIGSASVSGGNASHAACVGYTAGYNGAVASSYLGSAAGKNAGGQRNVGIGYRAVGGNSDGVQNLFGNVAVGYEAAAVLASTNASVTAVGYRALALLTTGEGNTAVGYQAGDGILAGTQNTLIGYNADIANANGAYNVIVGDSVSTSSGGNYATRVGSIGAVGNQAVSVGYGAGSTSGNGSISIGYNAGKGNGTFNVYVGTSAGEVTNGSDSVGIGYLSNRWTTGGSNVSIGREAAKGDATSTFSNTVAIGYQAGTSLTTGGNNVLIGYQSGSTLTTESNKLYIENSSSTTPLIYGEFDNDILRVNGTLQVGDPTSTGFAFPSTDGTANQVLSTDGAGTVTWVDQSGGGATDAAFDVGTEAAGRTLVAGDHLKYLRSTSATAVTFTVPPQSSVSWVDNAEIVFEQAGAGQITIAAGSGVTINSSETLKSGQQYAVIGLKRVASDTWTLTGERELAP